MQRFEKTEDIPLVTSILLKRLPNSTHVYNMVKLKERLKISIFCLCLTSDVNDTWIVVLHYRKDYGKEIVMSIPPHGAENVSQELKNALRSNDFLDWNEKYFFVATERPLSYLIIQLGLENGNVLSIHPSSMFYIKDRSLPPISCPEDIEIRKLTKEDSETIVKNWKYSQDSTIEYIHDVIDLPSAGVFHKGKLASYIITSAYGIASFLHTDIEHRRKGYAKIAMIQILKEMKSYGLIPVSTVETQNTSSVKLHHNCNLEFLYDTDYILHS